MYCIYCGKKLEDTWKICPYCGSEHTYLVQGNEHQIKEIEVSEE